MAHVSANGIGLEYEEFGSRIGTPLLLISGFSQQSTSWPESFVDGLVDAGFWVITFDNRDIGLSHQFDDKGIPDLSRIVAGLNEGDHSHNDNVRRPVPAACDAGSTTGASGSSRSPIASQCD